MEVKECTECYGGGQGAHKASNGWKMNRMNPYSEGVNWTKG